MIQHVEAGGAASQRNAGNILYSNAGSPLVLTTRNLFSLVLALTVLRPSFPTVSMSSCRFYSGLMQITAALLATLAHCWHRQLLLSRSLNVNSQQLLLTRVAYKIHQLLFSPWLVVNSQQLILLFSLTVQYILVAFVSTLAYCKQSATDFAILADCTVHISSFCFHPGLL